jgi:hypothetical protein
MRTADYLLNGLKMKRQIFLKAGLVTPRDSLLYKQMFRITGNPRDRLALRLPELSFSLTKNFKSENCKLIVL